MTILYESDTDRDPTGSWNMPPATYNPCPTWCTTDHTTDLAPDVARIHLVYIGETPDGTRVTVEQVEHSTPDLRAVLEDGPAVVMLSTRWQDAVPAVPLTAAEAGVFAGRVRDLVAVGLLRRAAELAGGVR